MISAVIITPEEFPNHAVVGRLFRGWDMNLYRCSGYDSRRGFDMVEMTADGTAPVPNGRCPCVSERAIGSSFKRFEVVGAGDAERVLIRNAQGGKEWVARGEVAA